MTPATREHTLVDGAGWRHPWRLDWPPILVLAAAAGTAILLLTRFLAAPRQLWNDPIHDRNAHLYSGLCLATDLAHSRFGQMFSDLDAFRSWPPLHDGVLVGATLLLGHGDERWAVLPSLAGWVGTVVFAFLLARCAVSPGGTVAGLLAALLVLVSPAQRAFATDVMLESLGACLTLASLFFYVRTVQSHRVGAARALALTLTALFFCKYNYWLLVVFGLGADWFSTHRDACWAEIRRQASSGNGRRWLNREAKHPLTWLLVTLVVVIVMIAVTGGTDLELFGRRVSVHSGANLVTVAYALFFLRLFFWYRRTGRDRIRRSDPRIQRLVFWHVLPVSLWFLWPQKLFSFLWVNDPSANAGAHPQHSLLGGYDFYWSCLVRDYHAGAWSALIVMALVAVAVGAALQKRLQPGASAILWLSLLSALLTSHHPYHESRFLHSWIPAIWVAAGIGAGCLVRRRSPGGSVVFRPVFAVLTGALAAAHFPALVAPAHAPEGGLHPGSASILDVTDGYLPALANSRRAAVFSNVPMKFLAQWTYLQRYGRAKRLETEIRDFDPRASDNTPAFQTWIDATPSDTVVYVDFPPATTFFTPVPGGEGLGQIGALLARQHTFRLWQRMTFPEYGCAVTVWRRTR